MPSGGVHFDRDEQPAPIAWRRVAVAIAMALAIMTGVGWVLQAGG